MRALRRCKRSARSDACASEADLPADAQFDGLSSNRNPPVLDIRGRTPAHRKARRDEREPVLTSRAAVNLSAARESKKGGRRGAPGRLVVRNQGLPGAGRSPLRTGHGQLPASSE
jgi:hypothetical protein